MRMTIKRGAHIDDLDLLSQRMLAERHSAAAHSRTQWAATWVKTEVVSLYAAYMGYDGVVDRETGVWLMMVTPASAAVMRVAVAVTGDSFQEWTGWAGAQGRGPRMRCGAWRRRPGNERPRWGSTVEGTVWAGLR